jgi:tetratricopeptide (TPR) repeat protein
MNVGSKTVFAKEVKKLVELKLFNSAETLCSLFVSHLSTQSQAGESASTVSTALAEVYEMLADCLLEKGEVKRALQYFRSATQQRKSTLGCKYRHQSPVSSPEDARLRLKECRCLVALQDTTTALRDLEGIPAKFRDAATHLLLGELYTYAKRGRNAASCYKELLLLTPTATEVIERLVELGVEASEILALLDEAFRYNTHKEELGLTQGWLQGLVAALAHKRNRDDR